MHHNIKNQKKIPLLVKEVVLPVKKEPGITEYYCKESSRIATNHLKNGMEERTGNALNSFVKIGDHEVKSLGELLILEKKPLENYFGGTVGKKRIKKKNKHKRKTETIRILDCKELQTESNGEDIPLGGKQPVKKKEFVVEDEKIEKKTLLCKIDNFEKMREHKHQKSYIRQRLAEEKYIEQQENLVETWWEFMKRRNQLKQLSSDDNLTYPKPFCRDTSKDYNRFGISIIPRKFWNDDQADKFSKKPEKDDEKRKGKIFEPTSNQSELDNFEKIFFEKLVFVDDEDTDDCDYRCGIFQRSKNLN